MVLGIFYENLHVFGFAIKHISQLDGVLHLLIFLPLLCFKWTFGCNFKSIQNYIGQTLILAVPGIMLTILLLACTLRYINNYQELEWGMILTFCALVAATDSGPATAALVNAKSKLRLITLIDGESLINNGVSAMFFFTFVDMMQSETYDAEKFAVQFVKVSLGGIAVGLAVGMVLGPFMRNFKNPYVITAMALLAQYSSFFIVEMSMIGFHVPGLLALVVVGMYLSATVRPHINPESLSVIYSIWDFIGFISSSLVFLITGSFMGVYIRDNILNDDKGLFTWVDFGKMFAFIGLTLLFRMVVIVFSWPILNCFHRKLSWKDIIILSYSGFRGVVGISIGFFIARNDAFNDRFRIISFIYMAGTFIFTQIFQTFTLKPVMKWVGYNNFEKVKKKVLVDTKRKLFLKILKKLNQVQKNHDICYDTNLSIIYKIFNFKKHILNLRNLDDHFPLFFNFDNKKKCNRITEFDNYNDSNENNQDVSYFDFSNIFITENSAYTASSQNSYVNSTRKTLLNSNQNNSRNIN